MTAKQHFDSVSFSDFTQFLSSELINKIKEEFK